MKPRQPPTLIEEAVKRAHALRQGESRPQEIFQWMAESPRNVEELLLAQEVLDEIAELTPQQQTALAAESASESGKPDPNVIRLRDASNVGPPSSSSPLANRRWLALRAGAIAAVVLLTLAGAWAWQKHAWQTYSTAVGEQRIVELADGSSVHLNTDSQLRVRYTPQARELQLDAGEALFKVQQEAVRPFRVAVAGIQVQAIGTAFDVYRRARDVKVSVLEGVVQVAHARGGLPQRISAGRTVSVDLAGQAVPPMPLDPDAMAWRERRLVFRGNPLAQIAAEFNRYNRSPKIVVADSEAGRQRFVGTFDADAPEALMQALAVHPALRARRVDQEIVIELRK